MKLTESGEARIRGYLFILGRSLRSFLPKDVVTDALREVDGHIRERAQGVEAIPDERTALERILTELGPPLRVAQAYATELTIDEAVTTGRLLPLLRAVGHLATTTVVGFVAGLGVFIGYAVGLAFLLVAAMKPVFPNNVGLFVKDGVVRSFGGLFPVPPGTELRGGYWIVPCSVAAGLLIIVATHRGAKRFLTWWRGRTPVERAIASR
jgi:uncharacterized membrane protein